MKSASVGRSLLIVMGSGIGGGATLAVIIIFIVRFFHAI